MNRRAADYFHPFVSFCYTVVLAGMSMLFFHPLFIIIGLACAVVQNVILNGWRRTARQLAWSLPLCTVIALFNPIVSHGGKTLLFYLWDNPVTLEALLFGVCSGGVLLVVFLWLGVYNRLVSPDKFMYLFSRFAPAASMLVTMTQRMIPLFARRFHAISSVRRTLPPCRPLTYGRERGVKARYGAGLAEISILLSWSMEEGLDTADSMKARGYGCEKRTAFAIYRFTRRDAVALVLILVSAVLCFAGYYTSAGIAFYPRIRVITGTWGVVSAVAFGALAAALPIAEAHWAVLWVVRNRRMSNGTSTLSEMQKCYL